MSKLGLILGIAGMMAASAASGESHFDRGRVSMKQRDPDPEWKRKKCKSCRNCGYNCNPYNYKGHILIRNSKPNYNACDKYTKKNK